MKKMNYVLTQQSFGLADAPHWVKFAAVREVESLYSSFCDYMADTEIGIETLKDHLWAFIHMEYNYTMRDDIEQFCADYEYADDTIITVHYYADGSACLGEVSILGEHSLIFDLRTFEGLAKYAA